jgi:hypothetical protein
MTRTIARASEGEGDDQSQRTGLEMTPLRQRSIEELVILIILGFLIGTIAIVIVHYFML